MNANVGMQYLVAATVATYTPGTSITYNAGSNFAEAVSASLSWDRADGHFYGDDVELDSVFFVVDIGCFYYPSELHHAPIFILYSIFLAK